MTKIKPDGTETKPFVSYPPGSNVTLNVEKGKGILHPDILFSDDTEKMTINEKTLNIVFKDLGKIPSSIESLENNVFFEDHKYVNNKTSLQELGFQKRSQYQWYHPVLGEDLEHNWVWFEEDYDLASIIPRFFKAGFITGQKKVRMDIKRVLDI